MPSRSLCSASECRFIVPSQRGTKSLSQTFTLNVPSWWPAQLNPCSWVLSHLQESAKNTSLSSLLDPLTLALSILIIFLKKKHLPLLDLHSIHLLTACLKKKKKKTNTSFSILFVFYLFVFFLFIIQLTKSKKKASNTSLRYSFSILSVSFYLLYNKKNFLHVLR